MPMLLEEKEVLGRVLGPRLLWLVLLHRPVPEGGPSNRLACPCSFSACSSCWCTQKGLSKPAATRSCRTCSSSSLLKCVGSCTLLGKLITPSCAEASAPS